MPSIPLLDTRKPPSPLAKRRNVVEEATVTLLNTAIAGRFSEFQYKLVRDTFNKIPVDAGVAAL
jgi:hypothetical protein